MWTLLITLILIFIVSYIFSGRDILNPACVFCLSFIFCASIATIYADRWLLDLHTNTYFVIAGGVFLFSLVSVLVHAIFIGRNETGTNRCNFEFEYIQVKKWKIILLICFACLCLMATAMALMKNYGNNLPIAIHTYRAKSVFTDEEIMKLPKWLTISRRILGASVYFIPYILINNLFCKVKNNRTNNILLILYLVLALLNMSLFGGRQYFVNIILVIIVNYLIFRRRRQGIYHKSLPFKTIMAIAIVCCIVLFAFKNAAGLIGKELAGYTTMDYIAKYCGSEIKNLDIFLQESHVNSDIWGFQTFRSVYELFKIDLPLRDLPFYNVNGFELGNVCTTFYDYIYDFGYIGYVFLTVFMAFVQSIIYEKMTRIKNSYNSITLSAIFSFQFPNIILSFFSNEFYTYTFSGGFISFLIAWYILYCFLFGVQYNTSTGVVTIFKPKGQKTNGEFKMNI